MSWLNYFTTAGKAAKASRAAIADATESLARSTTVIAEEATKLAVKGDAAGAAKLLEQASQTVKQSKDLSAGKVLSETEKLAQLKRYGLIGGAGFLAYEKGVNGHGLLSTTAGMLLDTPEEGQGYVNKQWETFVGKHNAEKGLAELGVDAFLGDGSYQHATDEMGEAYHGISDRLSGFFSRPGQQPMPYPAQQGYDPAYFNAVNNPQAQVNQGGFLSRWGAATNGLNVPEYLSGLTGGHVTYNNLAQAIVGTFLTFGPFGKLAKLGGLLLGFNGYRSMMPSQQQHPMQQQGQQYNLQYAPMVAAVQSYDDEQVINRSGRTR